MSDLPKPPAAFVRFTERFPELAAAWERASAAGREGPLSSREARLAKLALAMGAQREGAVRSAARKALADGVPREALEQVAAMAASTLGFPAAVAAFSWIEQAASQMERSSSPEKD